MSVTKTVSPTGSYLIDIPSDVSEESDERVTSYWKKDRNVLLQISSYGRVKGNQLSARERLVARVAGESLSDLTWDVIKPEACFDVASASGKDSVGCSWIYCYAVWPDLSVFLTVSGPDKSMDAEGEWAKNAVRSIRRPASG